MKAFLTGFREGMQKPGPKGRRRTGLALGAIVGWVIVGAAAG